MQTNPDPWVRMIRLAGLAERARVAAMRRSRWLDRTGTAWPCDDPRYMQLTYRRRRLLEALDMTFEQILETERSKLAADAKP